MKAGRKPVELAPDEHRSRPRAARLRLVGDLLRLALLQLREFLLVPARLARDRAQEIHGLVEVCLRDGEGEDGAVGADFDAEISAERFDLGEQLFARPTPRAAVLQHLGRHACEAREIAVGGGAALHEQADLDERQRSQRDDVEREPAREVLLLDLRKRRFTLRARLGRGFARRLELSFSLRVGDRDLHVARVHGPLRLARGERTREGAEREGTGLGREAHGASFL